MPKNITEVPYTELVERLREVARIDSENDKGRARAAINHAYTKELPREEDWTFLLASSAISCTAQYKEGVATVTTQGTTVTFSAAATIVTGMTGRKIKFGDNPDVYDFTFTGTTAGTISPQLSGDVNVSGGAYVLFRSQYQLAGNFERFPKNGGLMVWQSGKPTILPEVPIQEYYRDYSANPGTPATCRVLTNVGTDGVPYVEVQPPPAKAINLPYDYLRKLTPMRETTAGTATIGASGTSVTFHGGARVVDMQTGMYFRIDAQGTGEDSEWYRILAVSAANSTATLQSAFGPTAASSGNYAVCHAPEIPARLHDAILFRAVGLVVLDQDDPAYQIYQGMYAKAIVDGKRLYKTRTYNQEVDTVFTEYHFRR